MLIRMGPRPDISPAALVATTNLPMFDEAYGRLREEYVGVSRKVIQSNSIIDAYSSTKIVRLDTRRYLPSR
jgi:hypothetical protein